ncbi:MAG: NosD domain-containing protein [Candidatus Bathyarchaeota archaeon]|nr:NosD domain-containing protein [Candidatus Bathyarchaeota archaeon]
MIKIVVIGVLSVLLLTSIVMLSFSIQPVEATSTIYIRADGSIEPSSANITRDYYNITYTFTDNNYETLVIERDNITVDGAGFILQTKTGNGISLSSLTNVTIKNLNIDAYADGVYLYYSSHITIFNCSIYLSSTGILLSSSSYNNIQRNNISRNTGDAIGLYGSSDHNVIRENMLASNNNVGVYLAGSHNSVYRNNITDHARGISVGGDFHSIYENNVTRNTRGNGEGISVSSGGGGCNVSYNYVAENKIGFFLQPGTIQDYAPNTLKGNVMENNSFLNFGILNYDSAGDNVAKLYNDIDVSNTVNGKPIYYWINRENDTVPSDAGFVALINCRNMTVENLALERNLEGVLLAFSNNCTISGNNITNNGHVGYGVGSLVLYRSSNNYIYKNNVVTSSWTGLGIVLDQYSSYNIISENNLTKNSVGIRIMSSTQFNNIFKNHMENNDQGIRFDGVYSANNTVYNNNIMGPGTYGIYLGAQYTILSENDIIYYRYGVYVTASYNTIAGNNIMENWGRGLLVDNSFNTFVENNILNNNEGVYLDGYGKNNTFFHNNFVDNTKHVTYYWSGIVNSWNNTYPIGGNYWSEYESKYPNATELDNSGLWNTPYVINENNIDYYPLMAPTKPITRKFTAYDDLKVEIYSNSSISEFQFNTADKKLSFNVTGPTGTGGFCDVTIPENLLWGTFSLFINGIPLTEGVNYTKTYNGTHYTFQITYTHSQHIIEIIGTEVIPEFPSAIIIPLLMALTMLALVVAERRRPKT